jgi:dTDP-4-dehydrorhamnose 3,5-epimerase
VRNFDVEETPLDGVFVGRILSKQDARGYFERVYCEDEYEGLIGRPLSIRQINRSMSREVGTLRGCHFQWPPMAETKIVSCPSGRLYDVAVDLRAGSPTYLKYFGIELSSKNKKFMVIPEGFGHGFQTLEPNTEILYLVTQKFSLPHDDGINPLDPAVGIHWPIPVTVRSEKDANRKFLDDRNFNGISDTTKSTIER